MADTFISSEILDLIDQFKGALEEKESLAEQTKRNNALVIEIRDKLAQATETVSCTVASKTTLRRQTGRRTRLSASGLISPTLRRNGPPGASRWEPMTPMPPEPR